MSTFPRPAPAARPLSTRAAGPMSCWRILLLVPPLIVGGISYWWFTVEHPSFLIVLLDGRLARVSVDMWAAGTARFCILYGVLATVLLLHARRTRFAAFVSGWSLLLAAAA